MLPNIAIRVDNKVFLKDPESSDLGKRIIEGSIRMIDEMGFDQFTFRKLGKEIGSTEASIYRYFESKHKLLLYLVTWYWRWMEYRLTFGLANIPCARERLSKALVLLTEQIEEDGSFAHINEIRLARIVISDASKVYLTKEVDEENRDGLFSVYRQLVAKVSDIVLEIAPDYKYAHMLVSTVIEGSHNQRYFAEHLPWLTDVVKGEDAITEFYKEMVFACMEEQEKK